MLDKLFVSVTRAGTIENYDAANLHVSNNSYLNIVDIDGQAHAIPADLWDVIQIRRVQMPDMQNHVGEMKPR